MKHLSRNRRAFPIAPKRARNAIRSRWALERIVTGATSWRYTCGAIATMAIVALLVVGCRVVP